MLSEKLQRTLQQRPLGMFFDIDGTLSDIATTPDEARLYPGVREVLRELKHYAEIIIITGRSIEDGARMVGLDNITYIGTHGLEWASGHPTTHPPTLLPEAQPFVEPSKELMGIAEKKLSKIPGILFVHKAVGGTIHYRATPNPEEAREIILREMSGPAQRLGLILQDSKLNVDIRIPKRVNKGSAIRRYTELHQLRGVFFAGDDLTDLDAMYASHVLYSRAGYNTYSITVQHADTDRELIEIADNVVKGVEGMYRLLLEMSDFLRQAPVLQKP
jgi:trehalose 6-phosphate phosphatase